MMIKFPISRDPPEGGTNIQSTWDWVNPSCFQFLGIPPKGEHYQIALCLIVIVS